ncbi:MAG: oxygenase MpaB family protein [Candidatus Dormibacteria bacterium]
MRIPGAADLTTAIRTLMPSAQRALPIRDTSPDPGLCGPGSVTGRVMAEPVLMLGAGRALLMQAAQPLVAEGAIEHSTYATDPYGRFERTVEWVTIVCFGTTAEARRACRHINRLHGAVEGRLKAAHGTRVVRGGTAYSGRDPELLRWVHATFVDTMLVTHDAFVGSLTEEDADRFVREWDAVAALMGVPAASLWGSRAALADYVQQQQEAKTGPCRPGAGSRLVAQTVLRPPVSSAAMRPGWAVVTFATVGLLPSSMRRAYGIRWTPAHAAAHAAMSLGLRTGRIALPRRFKVSPVHDHALARSQGRLEAQAGAA